MANARWSRIWTLFMETDLSLPSSKSRNNENVLSQFNQIHALIIKLKKNKKKTPWPLVRKRTIPTEQPPHVGQVSANFRG
jgi:hypothetical protein